MSLLAALSRTINGSIAAHMYRRLLGVEEPAPTPAPTPDPSGSRGYWTRCRVATVSETVTVAATRGEPAREEREVVMRVATDGIRIRVRCTDFRFDPPVEWDVRDFQAAMAAAMAIGIIPLGDVRVERDDLDPKDVAWRQAGQV
jgi:hypothetical protein